MAAISLPDQIRSDAAHGQRLNQIARNRDYYNGKHRIIASGKRAAVANPRNYLALFVDTIVAHIGTASVSFGDGSPADELDAYVTAHLAENDADCVDSDSETAAAVDGYAVQKVTWDDQQHRPRVAHVDSAAVWMRTNPADPASIETIAQQYRLDADDFPAVFPGRVVQNAPPDSLVTEAWTARTWEVWLQNELVFREPNPYGFLPYVCWPNIRRPGADPCGVADAALLAGQQDALNQKYHDKDGALLLAQAIVILEGVDSSDTLSVFPGAMWTLPEGGRASILEMLANGAIQQRLEDLADTRQAMHDTAQVPAAALGSFSGTPSGLALQIALQSLLRLVARKRLYRTPARRQRAAMFARLGSLYAGLPPWSGPSPAVEWHEAIPTDRAAELENAAAELRLGRDPAEVLRSIGVEDPDRELAANLAHQRAATPADTGQPTQPEAQ